MGQNFIVLLIFVGIIALVALTIWARGKPKTIVSEHGTPDMMIERAKREAAIKQAEEDAEYQRRLDAAKGQGKP